MLDTLTDPERRMLLAAKEAILLTMRDPEAINAMSIETHEALLKVALDMKKLPLQEHP